MEKTEQEVLIEAKLQSMKAARRTIWITRWDAGEGMVRLAINNGRDGTYLVSRRFGREMFKRYVFDPGNQTGKPQDNGTDRPEQDNNTDQQQS